MSSQLFQKPPLQEDVEILLGLRKRRSQPLPARVSKSRGRPFTITAEQFGAPRLHPPRLCDVYRIAR